MQKKSKKFKVITNKYSNTKQWKKDPAFSDEEIEIANRGFEILAERCNPLFRDFVWKKEKVEENEIKII